MKTSKIIYWSATILFAGFMILSAIPGILMTEESVQFITHLGYPKYFIPFISIAKLSGSIAILIPFFKKIKEWAYAGLFFDLIAAVYSIIRTDGIDVSMSFMIILFALAITSYIYNSKLFGSRTVWGREELPDRNLQI